jgi:hypothetical protein
MKNLPFFLMLSILLFFGCSQQSDTLTEDEKTKIEQEINSIMDQINEGMNTHDVDRIVANWLKTEDFIYVGNGHVIAYDDLYKNLSQVHSNPRFQTTKISYDNMIIKVLSRDQVMVIGDCYLNDFPSGDGLKPLKFAITFLFENINDTWQMTIGHESTPTIFN